MRPFDRNAQFLRQRNGLATMIDMAVRDQDLFKLDALLRQRRFQPGQVAAGIDPRTELSA